ncbi:NUDIX hydrolase [Aquicella lusitana]|uniref:NUDIX domain-containing protein n=1 Tax=Aquicella lusitana TaxID=254246 RepID=A0A370GJ42_9COXI|nr:CoA pyrophosphatase [Aquicella lusitana]RDI43765.1 NUDIX domain-containing protein [Aquicella lusitana]VVC74504.1 putative Nudix hydrolase NudL [Aquicella lusitana]
MIQTWPDINALIRILSAYRPVMLPETAERAAVMLILLVDEDDQVEIVLTKRAATLPAYAGHFSLPGGMHDKTDINLYQTAVREVHEELNLSETVYQHIGQLDDFSAREGHLVRPFVTVMQKRNFEKMHALAPSEIDHIYYLALTRLDRFVDDPALHVLTRRRPSYVFREGEVFIWGLTASILVHLFDIIKTTLDYK